MPQDLQREWQNHLEIYFSQGVTFYLRPVLIYRKRF